VFIIMLSGLISEDGRIDKKKRSGDADSQRSIADFLWFSDLA
jgi:hypothetical protein